MKLTTFGRAEHRQLSSAVLAALENVAATYGVTFKVNGGNIGASSGMMKLEVELAGVVSQAQQMFNLYCHSFGLEPEQFGHRFVVGATIYEIAGINPRAPKYPIIGKRLSDGVQFKFPVSTVRRAAPKKAA